MGWWKSRRKAAVVFVKPKRVINKVFVHCSASENEAHDDVSVIKQWHLARGWSDVGYHFYIKKNGLIQKGRPLHVVPAAQKGHNTGSIAICLGGLKEFTEAQFDSLRELCDTIRKEMPHVTFHGHCEVEPNKTCPVFDYKKVLGLNNKGVMK